MRGFRLSDRMEAVVKLVPENIRVADVGCDHAYVSIYLATHKGCKVYAMDLREGPLKIAKENIEEAGLSDSIEVIKSDGLREISPEKIDGVVISGMGGLLIKEILDASSDTVASLKYLILQPQSEVEKLRRYIHMIGFEIVDEDMVWDDGKPYFMMRCERGGKNISWSDADYLYGKCLIEKRHPGLIIYLKRRLSTLEEIGSNLKNSCLSDKVKERIESVELEEKGIKEILIKASEDFIL